MSQIIYDGNKILLVDQTKPKEQSVHIANVDKMVDAIQSKAVIGAKNLAVAAAYGMLIAAKSAPTCSYGAFIAVLTNHGEYLASACPAEQSYVKTISRMRDIAQEMQSDGITEIIEAIEKEAQLIALENL